MSNPVSDLKRLLIVTEAGQAWPSGYIRAYIYQDLFAEQGIEVDFVPRQLPWLVNLIERPGKTMQRVLQLGLGRALVRISSKIARSREEKILRQCSKGYDAVYLQKVSSWRFISKLRRVSGLRLVYDLNDGVWLPSRKGFADGHIRDILRCVDGVTCDNPYGLEFARAYNHSLFLVPDPPQIEEFDKLRSLVGKSETNVVLGWIGSPGTLFNLYAIWEPLEKIFMHHEGIHLRLVGAGHDRYLWPRFENVRYSALPYYSHDQMVREVLGMDIGLFPLFDIEDSRVRGILKATVYMSGEAAVVATPVGQNATLINPRENGLLATSSDEWIASLSALIADPQLRRQLAANGLQTVRGAFTVRDCFDQLCRSLAG